MLKKVFGVSLLTAFLSLGAMSAAAMAADLQCPEGYTQCSIYFDDGSGNLKYVGEACCG